MIDDKIVVNADGRHSFESKYGAIYLAQGRYNIKLVYFQADGEKGLEVVCKGSGIEKQAISADMLFLP